MQIIRPGRAEQASGRGNIFFFSPEEVTFEEYLNFHQVDRGASISGREKSMCRDAGQSSPWENVSREQRYQVKWRVRKEELVHWEENVLVPEGLLDLHSNL